MSERLNYKECREKIFTLIDKSSIISREDIVRALGIPFEKIVYTDSYNKFRNFIRYTRKYANREYAKSKDERVPISNIIFFREIINKGKGTVREFIQFCEFERIQYLN